MMRSLILPCETKVREFDAKLLLGIVAVSNGIPAIVGAKKSLDLNLARFPPGVYVGKSATARSRHNLTLARFCGHRVALWDEEALVWASREVYWQTKVDGSTLNEPELLIAWGEDNAAAWREHPDYTGTPIVACGNPRADLLKRPLQKLFSEEVETLRTEYGRFVLINTNFSRVNHVQPSQNRHLKWLRERRPDDPRGGFAAHKYQLFQAFNEMIPQLARALPEIRFIIRPHPSERCATWDELAGSLDNVQVVQKGNVVAWLLAADGLIHNGCTTALEAFQLGRPGLAYRPVQSTEFDHPLPNGVSLSCYELDELVQLVQACHQDRDAVFRRQSESGGQDLMSSALAGMGRERLDSEVIVEALRPLLNDSRLPVGSRPRVARALLGLRRLIRAVEHRLPGAANYRPYLAHMFPDTSVDQVRRRCHLLAECVGVDEPPVIRLLAPNVFELQGQSHLDNN